MKPGRLTHLDRVALLVILLIAIGLRFHNLGQIEHNVDHAYPVWQAYQTLDRGLWPLTGQATSVLFDNPPLTGYLFALPLALTRSVWSVYVLVVALNSLGVWLSFQATRQVLGVRVGLLAAALLAVNPWLIEYSRYSWPPALVPFLLPLVAWLWWPIWAGTATHPRRRALWGAVALALMLQTTLIVIFMLGTVGALTLLFWRRLPLKTWLAAGLLGAAILAPYGVGLLQNAQRLESQTERFNAVQTQAELKPDAFEHGVRLVSGFGYPQVRGTQAPIDDAALRDAITQVLSAGVLLALLLGTAVAGWAVLRPQACQVPPEVSLERGRAGAAIALVWFWLPVALMSYNATLVHPYYLLVTVPAGAVLAAWGLAYVFNPYLRFGLVLIPLGIAFALVMGLNSLRHYQETRAIPGAHELGALSVEWGTRLGDAIDAHLPEGGVVFADVDDWTLNSLTGRLFPVVRAVDMRETVIIPQSGGLVIRALSDEIAPPLGAQRVETLQLPDSVTITLDRYPPNPTPELDITPYPAQAERWLSFVGYALSQQDDAVSLSLWWRVEGFERIEGAAGTLYAPFVHLLDADGERRRIIDGTVIPGYLWRVGDWHGHRLRFTLPEAGGPFSLRVGQYDGVHQQGMTVILPDGTYTQSIELPERLRHVE